MLSLLILFFTQTAFASFEFTPITAVLSPSGDGKSATFKVTNGGDTKLPIQITLFAREPDLDGKEVYKESDAVDAMFTVFPDQFVLEGRKTRNVIVTYTGSPRISTEAAFRIIAEELPIDVDDPNKKYTKAVARISIATRYIGSLYVRPAGAKPNLVVEANQNEKNTSQMTVKISNSGTSHMVVKKPTLKIRSANGGKELALSGNDIKEIASQNILAGRARRFNIQWPKTLPPGPLKVNIEVPQE